MKNPDSSDDDPLAAFDLDDTTEIDRVQLYRNDGDGPRYRAVPFVIRETFDDGQVWYHEPADFEVTEAYREGVAKHAPVRPERIKLGRDIPTYGFEPL